VTSDSVAAYIASQLQATNVLLIKDIDGVYTCDPKKHSDAKLLSNMPASQLIEWNKPTSVDKFLPKLLVGLHLDCYVVNGLFPQRIEAVLDEKETVCTKIAGN
jgi:aspartokinase-like uncharacterized kinase